MADYDGDGAADLLITSKSGVNLLLRNEGGDGEQFAAPGSQRPE